MKRANAKKKAETCWQARPEENQHRVKLQENTIIVDVCYNSVS